MGQTKNDTKTSLRVETVSGAGVMRFITKKSALIVLVLVIVAGGIFWWVHVHNSNKNQNTVSASTDNTEYANLKASMLNASQTNQYEQVAGLWVAYAGQTPSKTHKHKAYIYAANMYYNAGQYALALKMCKNAEAVSGITYEEAEMAAMTARKLHENATAIFYYRKAIQMMPSTLSDPVTQKSVFNADIQELQG